MPFGLVACGCASHALASAPPLFPLPPCLQERDPQNLLQPLAQALGERQVSIAHALFVPPDSTYMKLGAAAEAPDLSWQHSLQAVWEAATAGGAAAAAANGARSLQPRLALPPPPVVPPPGLPAAAAAAAAAGGVPRAAVLPSLGATLDWLRRCVREAPSLRMQVLVTGSLYLVGDLLKALQQGPQGRA